MGLQLQALQLLFGELGGEGLPVVAAAALAVVHRDVGVLDQLLRAAAVDRRLRDADARGDAEYIGSGEKVLVNTSTGEFAGRAD